jgi:hypothetical protein
VLELDHHCPWSSKCIGAGNIQPFRYFLGFLLLHCVFTGVVSGCRPQCALACTRTRATHALSLTHTHAQLTPTHLARTQTFFVWLVTKGVGAASS